MDVKEFLANNVIDMLAAAIALMAFIFSLAQFFDEKRRARSEATIHAFDDLEQKVFHRQEYKALLNMIEQQKVSKDALERVDFNPDDWNKLTEYLSLIEHFAVGVNCKTYDIRILRRLGKTFIINQWNKLEPIIDYKRKENVNVSTNIYTEFEKMVNNLKRNRWQALCRTCKPRLAHC